ncbi:hypothetical protein EQG49_03640 [Periweissella cryptocerci]|uniref:CN hydrolase domain-containing protein n=1 Tax=Periweissella cryptocerci TaxID=2506420 RepID=A0A4V1AII4_9LACO|nr:nitrilase-related carbon-nitrogen hydrolase [Periweissella cryptocerci]QBO35615.1 hypothetical protein EQG49_03640 [Periweissella cryptocerci]
MSNSIAEARVSRLPESATKFKIGMLQHSMQSFPDSIEKTVAANIATATKQIETLAQAGAKVICTTELFNGPYFCQVEDPEFLRLYAEPSPANVGGKKVYPAGHTNAQMAQLAAKLEVFIVSSWYELNIDSAGTEHFYNTLSLFDDTGAEIGTYRKHHIPRGPNYFEDYYFEASGDAQDDGYVVVPTKYGNIGLLICWDEWFSEPSRILAMKGADYIFYPSAIGTDAAFENDNLSKAHMWQNAIRSHAVQNNIYTCASNRVGTEYITDLPTNLTGPANGREFIPFFGNGFVADPSGELVSRYAGKNDTDTAAMGEVAEAPLIADIDLDMLDDYRKSFHFLTFRRPETYDLLTEPLD